MQKFNIKQKPLNKKSDEASCMPVIQSIPSQFLTTSFRSWPAARIIAAPESQKIITIRRIT